MFAAAETVVGQVGEYKYRIANAFLYCQQAGAGDCDGPLERERWKRVELRKTACEPLI